jgi:hypothetical protein
MRCIIAGGREHTERRILEAALSSCPFVDDITMVVSGMGRGFDQLGVAWARERGLPVDPHPAPWRTHRRGAGHYRNEMMGTVADALIAVPGAGNGTRHMIAVATRLGLRIHVFDLHGGPEARILSPMPFELGS